ncbi:MAG: N,N-dimethylformamidase beta subunit family domain-containing protein [Ktedonobacteraceae bacterium]
MKCTLVIKRLFRLVLGSLLLAAVLLLALPGGQPFSLAHLFQSPAAAAANPIQVENSNPGTSGWDAFASVAQQDAISGYGSKISVNHGDSIDFYVTTTAASFTIDIFRTGWYQGIGARKLASLGSFPGVHQAIPPPDPVTGMVACNWTKTTTLSIPSTWVTGVYLAKLTASNGNASFIFFVVRNDGGNENIMFQTSVTTYQAYNQWGGVSLYNNTTNGSVYKYPHATKVSFDRPFDPNDSNGAGHYLYYEYPFIRWAESQGYDLTYITNVDTNTNVNPLTNHKAFLSVGHDEYWSKGMRDNVQNAINAGVNVAFFSANSVYWQIRFEPNAAGVPNRVQVGYKDFATSTAPPGPDPMWNVNNAIVTTNWRSDPVNKPENGLIGVMYQDQVNQNDAYVVQNASNWVYAGTGFVNGSSVPGIVGYEYDKVWNNGSTPAGLTVLSNSPVVGCCEGSGNSDSNSSIYTAASGARVFAGGTIQWSWGLDNYSANYANAGIQRTTANILNNFISGATTPSPAVSLSPTSLSFSNQQVNTTSASQAVTLTNSGNAALTINTIGVSGTNSGDFAQTNTCPISPSTLAANASCTISVTFTPTATGTRSASVSITDNASGSPHTVALSGSGTSAPAPAVSLSPSSLSFGNQNVNTTSAAQTVTLTNSGNAALTISSIGLSGTNSGDFAQTNNCPSTLAAGASCTINVTFTPTATGARSASVSITDNASGSPHSVALSGTGTTPAPAVSLTPSSLTFSSQVVGSTSAAQAVTLKNSGTADLTISTISLGGTNPGDFAQTNTCPISPSTLAAGASCTISVTFTPTATGTRNASVSITDNAADSPQTIALSGSGASAPAPAVSLTPSSLTFSSQAIGSTSAAQAVTLKNSGTAALTITAIGLTGTNAGDFAQTNTCPISPSTLAAGASCTINVTFTPTATGTRSASVTITDNASGSPHSVALSGTGSSTSNVIFSDGFESGSLPGNWTSTSVSTSNSLTLDSTLAHSGTASLKAGVAKGSAGNAYISKTISGQSSLDVRGYYYLSNPVNWGAVQLMSLYAQGTFIGWVTYNVDPSAPTLTFYNGANNHFYTCSLPSLNAWHSLEVQDVLSTTTTGSFTLWLDGTKACGATGIKTSPSSGLTVNQVVVGSDSSDNTAGLTMHIDDVVISKSYIGP